MKRKRIALAVVTVMAVAILGLVGGCTPGVTGIVTNPVIPGPVPPSEWIPSWQIQEAINAPGVVFSPEKTGYNSVPLERMQNAASELVLDSRWGPLTAAEAFIVQLKRADPQAAVGLAILGPPNNAEYRAITADIDHGVIILRLVDPLSRQITDWVGAPQGAFIPM